jgi:PKD repeat protein
MTSYREAAVGNGVARLLVLAALQGLVSTASAQQSCSAASDCQVFPPYEATCVDNQCLYVCGTGRGEACGPDWTEFVTDFQRNVIAVDEPINWVTRINAHNATSSWAYDSDDPDPNQAKTITEQLDAGARILSVDLHVLDDDLYLCHNDLCVFNRVLFSAIMQEIGLWLDANPGEFIWISIEYLPYRSCVTLPEGECQDASLTFDEILDRLDSGIRNLGAARVYRPIDVIPAGQDASGDDRYVHPESSPYYCSASRTFCSNDDDLCPEGESCELAYPTSPGDRRVRRWPTMRELQREGKQVMLSIGGLDGCCGEECGEYTVGSGLCSAHSTSATRGEACTDNDDCVGLRYVMTFLWRDSTLAPSASTVAKDFDFDNCDDGEYWDPVDHAVGFSQVSEARTAVDAFADTSGILEEGDVAILTACNVSRIALDFVDSAELTMDAVCAQYVDCENDTFGVDFLIPGGLGCFVAQCPADDTRILRTAWSWQWGVRPVDGSPRDTRAFMNGADGRWSPTAVENQQLFRCACGHNRVGEPLDWPDRRGDEWQVTSRGAAFKPQPENDRRDPAYLCQLACQAEHGLDFALPTSSYQSRRLHFALTQASLAAGTSLSQENVWLRLSRDQNGGPWTTAIEPWIASLTVAVNAFDPNQRDFTAVVENPDGYETSVLFLGSDGVSSSFLDPVQASGTTETFRWTKPFASEGHFTVEAQLWGNPEAGSTQVFRIDSATVALDFEFVSVPPTIDAFTSLDRSNLTPICNAVCIGHLLQWPGEFTDPNAGDPFQVRVLYGDADDSVCNGTSGTCTGASGGTRACAVDTDCGTIVPYTRIDAQTYRFEMTNLYAQSGVYDGTIVVDDGTQAVLHPFTVNNVDPPVAPQIGGGCAAATLFLGEVFTCSPAFTDLNAGDALVAQVVWGDGSAPEDLAILDIGAFGHSVILEHEFLAAGNFDVRLTVTDSAGLSDTQTYRVTIATATSIDPPTIQVVNPDGTTTAGPVFPGVAGTEGHTVARTFRIIDGNPSHTTWSLVVAWGDKVVEGGAIAINDTFSNLTRNANGHVEVTAIHIYPCSGSGCTSATTGTFGVYVFARAVLGATDFGPFSAPHTFTIDIRPDNELPVLDGVDTTDSRIDEGGLFSRTGQTFSDPDPNDPWVVYVDYGDGVIAQPTLTGNSFDLSHVYADNGTYTVQVIVGDGAANDSRTFDVRVDNVAPSASVDPDRQVQVGEVLEVSGAWVDPGAFRDKPYAWTWSVDGVQQTSGAAGYGGGIPFSTQFATPGSRTLTFEVTDKDGEVGSASLLVEVRGCVDQDGDGYWGLGDPSCPSAIADCNDQDPAIWGTPGETRNLLFKAKTKLAWDPPTDPGALGSALAYDTLRSEVASDFQAAALCVESNDGSDMTAVDLTVPAPGKLLFYLTRAENACPQGTGPLGTNSQGVPRAGRSCP